MQWEKTNFVAFTSDYQGAWALLTDPQIISKTYVLPASVLIFRIQLIFSASNLNQGKKLFGRGNLPSTLRAFRTTHRCNYFCNFFGLKLDGHSNAESQSHLGGNGGGNGDGDGDDTFGYASGDNTRLEYLN